MLAASRIEVTEIRPLIIRIGGGRYRQTGLLAVQQTLQEHRV
jgi:hypothetical protein